MAIRRPQRIKLVSYACTRTLSHPSLRSRRTAINECHGRPQLPRSFRSVHTHHQNLTADPILINAIRGTPRSLCSKPRQRLLFHQLVRSIHHCYGCVLLHRRIPLCTGHWCSDTISQPHHGAEVPLDFWTLGGSGLTSYR
jgi:hypothetical protein